MASRGDALHHQKLLELLWHFKDVVEVALLHAAAGGLLFKGVKKLCIQFSLGE